MKCKYCDRELPNKSFIRGNKCIWCDSEQGDNMKTLKNRIKEDLKNPEFKKEYEKKVYCGNCKYYFSKEKNGFESCGAFENVDITEGYFYDTHSSIKFTSPDITFKKLPREINKNNNCPHYKRKWYKFWVK